MKIIKLPLFAACLALFGCGILPRTARDADAGDGYTSNNLITIRKGNLVAMGTAKRMSQVDIFDIKIGTFEKPFDRRFSFSIRLKSGHVIRSDEFSLDIIRPIAERTNAIISGEWKGDVSYMIEGYNFIYNGKRLVQFSVSEYVLPGGRRLTGMLGDAKANQFFSLPLTKGQFYTLFGKPESEQSRTVL